MPKVSGRLARACQVAFLCITCLTDGGYAEAVRMGPIGPISPAAPFLVLAANDPEALALFSPELIDTARQAKYARVVLFTRTSEFAPARSVASAKVTDAGILASDALAKLRQLMFSNQSYQPLGLNAAPRFRPSYGFHLSSDTGEAWWLVAEYPGLATVMLVGKDTDWRRSTSLVLQPASRAVFNILTKQGRR